MATKLDVGQRFLISGLQTLPSRGMPREWHEEIEFFCVVSGQITLYIEDVVLSLCAGEVAVIPPNMLHWATHSPSLKASYETIIFSGALFSGRGERGYIGPLRLNGKAYILKLAPDDAWQSESLRLILALLELRPSIDGGEFASGVSGGLQRTTNATPNELEFCGLLFLLWSKIYHNSYIKLDATLAYQKLHRRLQSAINYIHEHFADDVSSRMMANQVHLNVATFCRYFKQLMGETPISYLNNYRVSKSRVLLIETNKKIADIAAECGYNNLSHFNRDFKNRMRCTPSAYRRGAI